MPNLPNFRFFDTAPSGDINSGTYAPSKPGLFSALGQTLTNIAVGIESPQSLATLQLQQHKADQEFQQYLAEQKQKAAELDYKKQDMLATLATKGITPYDPAKAPNGAMTLKNGQAADINGIPIPTPNTFEIAGLGKFNQSGSNVEDTLNSFIKLQAAKQSGMIPQNAQIGIDSRGNPTIKDSIAMNQLSSEQTDIAAQMMADGKLVPSQLPRQSRAEVAIAASKINPDFNPAKSDIEFAVNKMGAGAFEKNFNNLDSFHRDFEKNSDYLLKLSDDFDRSNIPLLNKAIVSGANQIQGNPKATQILQAVNTVANGYARLQNPTLGGQALSDAARAEAQSIVNGFYSKDQLRALLDPKDGSMRIDAQNRIDAALEVRKEIKQRYSGNNKTGELQTPSGVKFTYKAIGK